MLLLRDIPNRASRVLVTDSFNRGSPRSSPRRQQSTGLLHLDYSSPGHQHQKRGGFGLLFFGAGDRTRTGTALRPRDFKSLVSTIPPHQQVSVILAQFSFSVKGDKCRLMVLLSSLRREQARVYHLFTFPPCSGVPSVLCFSCNKRKENNYGSSQKILALFL